MHTHNATLLAHIHCLVKWVTSGEVGHVLLSGVLEDGQLGLGLVHVVLGHVAERNLCACLFMQISEGQGTY